MLLCLVKEIQSRELDWSLCWVDFGPWALCFEPLVQLEQSTLELLKAFP